MNLTFLTTVTMALITLSTAAPAVTPANVLTGPPMACYNIYCNPEVYGNSQCVNSGCSTCIVGVNKCA